MLIFEELVNVPLNIKSGLNDKYIRDYNFSLRGVRVGFPGSSATY